MNDLIAIRRKRAAEAPTAAVEEETPVEQPTVVAEVLPVEEPIAEEEVSVTVSSKKNKNKASEE